MYRLGDFLEQALFDYPIVIIDNDVRISATVCNIEETLNERNFTYWELEDNTIVFYLD